MKNIVYILGMLFSCSVSFVHAGEEKENVFPVKNAEWTLAMVSWNDPNFETNRGIVTFKIEGDTLIKNKIYHTLYYSEKWGDYNEASNLELQKIGAFRIENKKVWSTFDDGKHENLLYDFGANVGDTIWHGVFEGILPNFIESKGTNHYSVVESIRQSPFGKEFHVITHPYADEVMNIEDVWIEGIGSLQGFFATFLAYPVGNHDFYTRKLWKLIENGKLLYPENDPGILPYGLPSAEIFPIKIEYNQSFEELLIQSEEALYPCCLNVLDVEGCVIRSFFLYENMNISMNGLSSDMYICSLIKNGKVVATKKIWK